MKPKRVSRSEARAKDRIEFARSERAFSNEFAAIIWQQLRNRRCAGMKFRREYPIPPYTVDFCCLELKLIIEIDGKDHQTEKGQAYDQRRDAVLKSKGLYSLRVPGFQVVKNLAKVMDEIHRVVKERRGG